jgi:SAM-dependent methyltransferase
MSSRTGRRSRSDSSIWQEVEFGSYQADLPLWSELAAAAGGPVLELGAGAGRVARHLAAGGHRVIALEADPDLVGELEGAKAEEGLPIEPVTGDLTSEIDRDLPAEPGLVIGPLHVVQMIDVDARPDLLSRIARIGAPGATVALTVVDESTMLGAGTAATQILPDMRELDGWVYSSEPLWVQVGGEVLTVRRIRERVSPEGRVERQIHDEVLQRLPPERLEDEAARAGLRAAGRRQISSGPNEADSTVVMLGVPG